jgi:hypothetical protein
VAGPDYCAAGNSCVLYLVTPERSGPAGVSGKNSICEFQFKELRGKEWLVHYSGRSQLIAFRPKVAQRLSSGR